MVKEYTHDLNNDVRSIAGSYELDEEGREVAPGEAGELVIRGANVMRGYWNAPDLTAKTFRNGRYPGETLLYSGDLFRKDEEGFLYFLGRKDDLIKTKGERVGPKEIENVLCEVQGVLDAAVIGVPDEILGQAIKAFIVQAPGCALTAKEVLKYCHDRTYTKAQRCHRSWCLLQSIRPMNHNRCDLFHDRHLNCIAYESIQIELGCPIPLGYVRHYLGKFLMFDHSLNSLFLLTFYSPCVCLYNHCNTF